MNFWKFSITVNLTNFAKFLEIFFQNFYIKKLEKKNPGCNVCWGHNHTVIGYVSPLDIG
jgi:hypothetical protein